MVGATHLLSNVLVSVRTTAVHAGFTQDLYLQQQSRDLKIRARWGATLRSCYAVIITLVIRVVSEDKDWLPGGRRWGRGPDEAGLPSRSVGCQGSPTDF